MGTTAGPRQREPRFFTSLPFVAEIASLRVEKCARPTSSAVSGASDEDNSIDPTRSVKSSVALCVPDKPLPPRHASAPSVSAGANVARNRATRGPMPVAPGFAEAAGCAANRGWGCGSYVWRAMPYALSDVRLHYTDSGDGPAILWHTGGCGDGSMWETAGYISGLPGYRHVLLDHRGHGSSEMPTGSKAHEMSAYVDDVIAVLDAARIERAVMVGYSSGARVAYCSATRHPDRFVAIVGLDSVPEPGEDPEDMKAGAEIVMEKGTRAVIEEMAAGEPEPPPRWLLEHLCSTTREAFAGAYESFATAGDIFGHFGELTVPTLMLVGAEDEDDGRMEVAVRAAETMPNGQALGFFGLAHLQMFWRVDVILPAIRAFLAAHAPTD
jgi:pimeloyl-ACP methyl ester carboxylesterase